MELSEFISESLYQIHKGVLDANAKCKLLGKGAICPIFGEDENAANASHVQIAEFDVLLTTVKGGTGALNGKVAVYVAEIDVTGDLKAERSNAHRVKFTIPHIPPSTIISKSG